MTAITGLDGIVTILTNSSSVQDIFVYKTSLIGTTAITAPIAGRFTSLWRTNGTPTGATAAPGAASSPTNLTTGSFLHTNPTSSTGELWLLSAAANGLAAGTLLLYDRLAHMSGLNGTVTTTQTVSASATRYTGSTTAAGNQIWLEVYTAIGTAAPGTLTVIYRNQNGITHTTPAIEIGNTAEGEVGRMLQVPLATGDTGVIAVDSLLLTPSTATAGDFGVTIVRPLCWMPIGAVGTGVVRDLILDLPSIQKIEANACLALMFLATTTPLPEFFCSFEIVEK
jgi:hypothetical protein